MEKNKNSNVLTDQVIRYGSKVHTETKKEAVKRIKEMLYADKYDSKTQTVPDYLGDLQLGVLTLDMVPEYQKENAEALKEAQEQIRIEQEELARIKAEEDKKKEAALKADRLVPFKETYQEASEIAEELSISMNEALLVLLIRTVRWYG